MRITPRTIAAVAATAGCAALVLPAVAGAADYCVAPEASCGGTNVATFQEALDLADNATDPDRVFLGAATYTAPAASGFAYIESSSPVEILGHGTGKTILTSPTAGSYVLRLSGGAGTSVHDLTIRLPQNAAGGAKGLLTDDDARRIELIEDPVQAAYRTGAVLQSGAALEDSSVLLGTSHLTTAVNLGAGGGAVRRSAVSALKGVVSSRGGTVERSRVTGAHTGVAAYQGATTIAASVIRVTGGAGSNGLFLGTQPGAPNSTLNADGVTLIGPGVPDSYGLAASTSIAADRSADISLTNSIVRGFSTALEASSNGAGQAKIATAYSDYDPSGNSTTGPNSNITQANVSNVGEAGFVDAAGGDYHLLRTSPLVDRGDAATAQGLDLDGSPLVADGNGDGAARRDLGAFELPPAPAGVAQPPAGQGASLPDTQAPLVTGFRTTPSTFTIARARTVLAARLARGTRFRYTLSEPARVTLKIQRALAGRRVGLKCMRPTSRLRRAKRCTRYRTIGTLGGSGAQGANATRFTGRLGKRALRRGRYRAVIRATDTAGNRSARQATRFRVAAS
jgi:hypothetical protein